MDGPPLFQGAPFAMSTTRPIDSLESRFPETDGVPLESPWHREQITLLVHLTEHYCRDRDDFYVGGNMFVYWDRNDPRKSSGPDYMFIRGVERHRDRRIWAVWLEHDRFPNAIIELMSPRTKNKDRKTNKRKYEQIFHTPDYFFYDPETEEFRGWRLDEGRYVPLAPNDRGWLWSEELRLWLGTWYGPLDTGNTALWLRFYDANGELVPTPAEAQRRRAEAAEAELARLRSLLDESRKHADA